MIVNTKEMLNDAMINSYAVPQFNINNLEWTKFILEECEINKSPVILGVSSSAIKYMGSGKLVVDMIVNLVECLNIKIPVAIHFDHGNDLDFCLDLVNAGFTSIMLDYSNHDLDKNIEATKKLVTFCENRNISVEGEVGSIFDAKNSKNIVNKYADILDCIKYVSSTNVDSLAPAIGSMHGIYTLKPEINFDLIKKLKQELNIPLVLHGGSGISNDDLIKAIDSGICKINFNTELQQAWANAVREGLNENKDIIDPRKIIMLGEDAIKKCIKEKIVILKSNNRY